MVGDASAETSTPSPGRARVGAMLDAVGHQADAGGVDVDAVALAAVDDLGVAGRDGDARLARRRGHRVDDAAQRRPWAGPPRG